MNTRYGLLGIGVVLGLAIVLAGWKIQDRFYTYQGSLIDPPASAADFELTDQNGKPFRLSDQKGKVTLIFFGYTNCPDVCPATLSQFVEIKKRLGKNADAVHFVFITVDPQRDTTERVSDYLALFDPSFSGLTGDLPALEEVWKDYGVYREVVDDGSAAGALVDHSTITYAIDAQGHWRLTYPFGMETGKLVQDVRHLIQER